MAGAGNSKRKGKPRGKPFPAGVSGNPSGRPVTFRDDLRKLVGQTGGAAYDLIWKLAQGKVSFEEVEETFKSVPRPVWEHEDFGTDKRTEEQEKRVRRVPSFQVRLDAAKFLVEQLNGKAAQPIDVDSKHTVTVRWDLERLPEDQLQALLSASEVATAPAGELVEGAVVKPDEP